MARDAHPFWRFSLDVYRRPGVQDACLALQERSGADVNIVLLCCWAASLGMGPLAPAQLRDCIERTVRLQAEVIKPLRAVRRSLKAGIRGVSEASVKALREAILRAELDAEYIEQTVLTDALTAPATAATAAPAQALASLERYFAMLGAPRDAALRRDLATIVGACFPGVRDDGPHAG